MNASLYEFLISAAGNILLFALVFGMSATVDVRSMVKQITNVTAISIGIGCHFFFLPLLGFVVVKCFGLSQPTGLTLLVITSSPGGSYSNWWCSLFNADLALSVTMTAISTILSMIMLPINLLIYTHLMYRTKKDDVVQNLEWGSLTLALFVVISAIACGLYCTAKYQSRRVNRISNHLGNAAGFFLIVFSITMATTGSEETRIWTRPWYFYVGFAIPCTGGLLISILLTSILKFVKPERVTVAIECCYQNVGIATSLALTMFNGNDRKDAMAVPFLYGFVEACVVGTFCLVAWKINWTKAPSNANFCKMLVTSYEVLEYVRKDVNGVEISASDSCDDPDKNNVVVNNADGDILTSYICYEEQAAAAAAAGAGGKAVVDGDHNRDNNRQPSRSSHKKKKHHRRKSSTTSHQQVATDHHHHNNNDNDYDYDEDGNKLV